MRGIRGVVFGHDMETAITRLKAIAERYEQFQYAKIIEQHYSNHSAWIVFSNGDKWNALKGVPENCRGKRYNIAYIDRALPEDAIDYIRCCLTAPPYTGIQYFS